MPYALSGHVIYLYNIIKSFKQDEYCCLVKTQLISNSICLAELLAKAVFSNTSSF